MATKRIINDRQRARRVYGFVQRLPDPISLAATNAESIATMLSLDWKESVVVASTTNQTLPPPIVLDTIDDLVLADGDRILLKNQTNLSENGIYVVDVAGGTWSRADDAIPGDTLTCGAVVYVEDGTVNEGTKWVVTTKVVTLGGSIEWVLFDKGNDWIVSGSGGQMKTQDPVSIGGDFPSEISPDIYFYVSGSRIVGQPSLANTNISLFDGDVTISGTVNMIGSDGFWGDMLEISGSAKITTGSLYLQKAGTNDYMFFVESSTGNTFISGSLFASGSSTLGYGSEAIGLNSQAIGLFAKSQRNFQFSHAGSGFSSNYKTNTAGTTQYSRLVWTGTANNGDAQMYFKGYDNSGTLSQYLDLENGKSYHVKATAIVSDSADQTTSSTFVREALVYMSGGWATRIQINDTLSLPNTATWDFDVDVGGPLGNTSLIFSILAINPATFSLTGTMRGTVTIELCEIAM